jgi:hypothetical protein
MLLYSSTPPEDQWEYIGKCIECGANLYRKEGRVVPDCRVEDGHLCCIEPEENEEA